MKLAGNILPPVSKSIDRVIDRVTGLLGEPEPDVLKFGTLVRGQQQPEFSPENTALLLNPENQQDDDGELKITDEGEQELKLELTYSLGTQLIGQSPSLNQGTGLSIETSSRSSFPTNDRPPHANNSLAGLKMDLAKAAFEAGSPRENKPQPDGLLKNQLHNLTVEKDEGTLNIGRIAEQKTVPVPATTIITKAIIQNFQTQRIDVPSNNLAIVAPVASSSLRLIEVQLVPKNLGVVEVKIRLSNRHMDIVIETKTKEAESLLRLEMSSISKTLASAGLSVDEITIRYNPRLEHADSRENRLANTESDKLTQENFNGEKGQQSRPELDQKPLNQSQNSNKLSNSDPQNSSNTGLRRGVYM